jgi:hypothetical protein
MLTAYEHRQLRDIEAELQRDDRWLAEALTAHRWRRRPLRQRLVAAAEQALSAWMNAAGQQYYPWPGHRWL